MIQLAECVQCGEYRNGTLREIKEKPFCYNCATYADNKPMQRCFLCNGMYPSENHHVLGRRNSPLTVPLCCNCHRWVENTPEVKLLLAEHLPLLEQIFSLRALTGESDTKLLCSLTENNL